VKNYFSLLLNIHNISVVRQREIHTAEPLVPGSSHVGFENSIAQLKKYKCLGSNEIQAGGEILVSLIPKIINSIWNKFELPDQWNESIILSVHKNLDKTYYNYYCGISLLSTSYKILSDIILS
jgi:hypothetical protein